MHQIILAFALWTISGVLSYGLLYPFFRHVAAYDPSVEHADHSGALVISLAGPIALIIIVPFADWGCHGLSWQRDKASV